MDKKIIQLGMYLTGRKKSTIEQMYETWLKKYPFIWKLDKNEPVCKCDNQQPDPLTGGSVCENCGGNIELKLTKQNESWD